MPDVSTRPLSAPTSRTRPAGEGDEPLVSVVIPVYNRVGLLRHTIRSVRAQSLADWELILVDDGSTEDVAALASSFGDERIRVIRQENLGSAAARNRGLRGARGALLVCLDSDDLWAPAFLAEAVAALRAHPSRDAAYALVEAVDGDGRSIELRIQPEPRSGDLLEDLLEGRPLYPSSVLFRRGCVDRWGGFQDGMDDWEMWIRWSIGGCRFHCVPQDLVRYRIHAGNEHLNWSVRYSMHLAMIEEVLCSPEMPPQLRQREAELIGRQHVEFALLAWQLCRPEDGATAFAHAVACDARWALDGDMYYALACAHMGRLGAGPGRPFEASRARRTIDAAIQILQERMPEGMPALASRDLRRARAAAELACARASYVHSDEEWAARSALWRAVRAQPSALLTPEGLSWALRVGIGRRGVERLRGSAASV